jgi:hypothetical protein
MTGILVFQHARYAVYRTWWTCMLSTVRNAYGSLSISSVLMVVPTFDCENELGELINMEQVGIGLEELDDEAIE